MAGDFGRDGDMGRFGGLAYPLIRVLAHTPEQGARTQVYVASSPALEGVTGGYWAKCAAATPSKAALADAAAARLWEVSEQLTR